ncbi:MAG: penicillin acylase family protein [Burkholderiaceae bacterium]|nr:penicillin acylase family protein [Burkholderiaceae bacterium]
MLSYRRALLALACSASCFLVSAADANGQQTLTVQKPGEADLARWTAEARRVTVIRDRWGVPHVYGGSDADAVFGLMYAQAEDDFNRIELNYINALGRLAEVEGETELYRDLRMKLFINPADMQARYAASPAWLKKIMSSFADGLNYYLFTHPQVKPKLLTRFEPWMALTFSEGSIGGDIESINLHQLEEFYGEKPPLLASLEMRPESALEAEPRGSNGFAIAPARSASGHALLLINPHTSLYFRSEVNVVSGEGLNAYGAVTWGQFFVYQGFNDRIGWMHTSGGGIVVNEYLETVSGRDGKFTYRYGGEQRLLKAVPITLRYKTASGMAEKTVTAYYSHHGPIVRSIDGKWVAVRLMQEPVKALEQSYLRTKARTYKQFYEVMKLRTNSSNNTVYADADGNIAYFHGNFMPIRDPRFDWRHPVDGSDPATEWKGLHEVKDTINLLNPPNGWIQNTNNWPFSAAGPSSPRREDYPDYMWVYPENARGLHAVRVLQDRSGFTLDSLIAAANDSYLTGFESLIPALTQAYDGIGVTDPLKLQVMEQIDVLRSWDLRYSLQSVPTSLAIYWGQHLMEKVAKMAKEQNVPVLEYMALRTTPQERLQALARASAKLERDFGTWKTPWGEINRFQRLSGDVNQAYEDDKPSIPVPFTSSVWGSLAAFGVSSASASAQNKTRRIYGDRGNSFEAVVEFGPRIRAKSLLGGGESGDPHSPHFYDQAEMYARSEYKDVLFYRADVEKHAERKYHPGQ